MSKQASRSHLPQARIADSSSRNAVSFSSAPTTDDGQHPSLCSVDFKFENLRCVIELDGSSGFVACQAARQFMKTRGRKRPYRFSTVFFGSDTRRTSFLTQIVVTHAIDCKLSTVGRVTPCALTDRKSVFSRVYRCPVNARIIKIKRTNPSPPLGQ
jgi:hypothetical protein